MNGRGKPIIALVAGESSGDQLGASLIRRLAEAYPQAQFAGIGGREMKNAGMDTWWDAEELAIMGLFEVLSHLPRLLRLRRDLYRRLLALSPDVFIGVDAPDFNLGLEVKLRRSGIRTIQYVSPAVWAWRQHRVRKIERAADLVLCLFPFEPDFFREHGVRATYVGHPMADVIAPDSDPASARRRLDLDPAATTIALLPGSRAGEVSRLAEPMIEAARTLAASRPGLQFVGAMAGEKVSTMFRETMDALGFTGITLVDQDPRTVIAAADAVMCASGTATLEIMLVNRPMVVAYRISALTYYLVKQIRLIKADLFALPNILAGKALVPELIQHDATPARLAREIERWLQDEKSRAELRERFIDLHDRLRCDAAKRAAEAVRGILER